MFQREYIMGLTPVGGEALRCRERSTTRAMEFMLTNMYTKVGRAKRSVVLLKRPEEFSMPVLNLLHHGLLHQMLFYCTPDNGFPSGCTLLPIFNGVSEI